MKEGRPQKSEQASVATDAEFERRVSHMMSFDLIDFETCQRFQMAGSFEMLELHHNQRSIFGKSDHNHEHLVVFMASYEHRPSISARIWLYPLF